MSRFSLVIPLYRSEPNLPRPLLFNYDGTLRRGLEELGTGALGNPTLGSFALDANHDLLFSSALK